MRIEWRTAMTVDGALIDDDHRYLFKLINAFNASLDREFDQGEIKTILSSLKYYTVYHFVREEAAQVAALYPDHARHSAEHRRLVGLVDRAVAMLEHDIPPDQQSRIKHQISRLLQNWLVTHIIKFDLPMRPHVRNIRSAMRGVTPISRT